MATCWYCVECRTLRASKCVEHPAPAVNIQIDNVECESLQPLIDRLQAENILLHAMDLRGRQHEEQAVLAAAIHLLRARGRPVFGGYLVDVDGLEKELTGAEFALTPPTENPPAMGKRCTECRHEFSAADLAAEDPCVPGHPCHAVTVPASCESYREAIFDTSEPKPLGERLREAARQIRGDE